MLTRKQYLLLLFIDERLRTTGISPSFDEMKEALNLKSKSGIHRLIKGLEERGFVRRLPHRARALEVLRLPSNLADDGMGDAPLPPLPGQEAAWGYEAPGPGAGFAPGPGAGFAPGFAPGSRPSGAGGPAPTWGEQAGSPAARSRLPQGGAGSRVPQARQGVRREAVVSDHGIAAGASGPDDRVPGAGYRAGAGPDMATGSVGGFSPQVIRGDFTPNLPAAHVTAAQATEAVGLPLLGKIAAGTPIAALSDTTTVVDVPASLLGDGDHFALTVEGDSMIDAGILDGDRVIIRRGETADNGSIVVALIDNEEATLKRLRRKGASIALEPANALYKTQIYGPDRVRIQGCLVGLIRSYAPKPA